MVLWLRIWRDCLPVCGFAVGLRLLDVQALAHRASLNCTFRFSDYNYQLSNQQFQTGTSGAALDQHSTDTPGITLQWQWGAAVYSSFSTTYATTGPSNTNVLGVNAEDGSADPNGTDPAGTPETYKGSLLFGATDGGLNSYIGFLTPGAGVVPTIAPPECLAE